jgi:hypothetical protein
MRERTFLQIDIQTLPVEILAFRYVGGPHVCDERIIANALIEEAIGNQKSASVRDSCISRWHPIYGEIGVSRSLCWVGFKSTEIKMSETCLQT